MKVVGQSKFAFFLPNRAVFGPLFFMLDAPFTTTTMINLKMPLDMLSRDPFHPLRRTTNPTLQLA